MILFLQLALDLGKVLRQVGLRARLQIVRRLFHVLYRPNRLCALIIELSLRLVELGDADAPLGLRLRVARVVGIVHPCWLRYVLLHVVSLEHVLRVLH